MRAMALAAVLVAAASFSSHASVSQCRSVDEARTLITSSGGLFLGLAEPHPITVPATLGADKVITAIMGGSLWRIPVDATGCAAETGFKSVGDVEA